MPLTFILMCIFAIALLPQPARSRAARDGAAQHDAGDLGAELAPARGRRRAGLVIASAACDGGGDGRLVERRPDEGGARCLGE